jgi:hypothetical protein
MGVYNGKMYVSSAEKIYQYDGSSWGIIKQFTDVARIGDMKTYNNKLYIATTDVGSRCIDTSFCGRIIEYDGTNWNTILDHNGSGGYWMFSLEVYNNKLYAGTANKIYVYDGASGYLSFDNVAGAQYVLSLKTWNTNLYGGTGGMNVIKKNYCG